MSFREHPFRGGYTVAAGLRSVVERIESLSFDDEDRAYLAQLTGNDGKPLLKLGFSTISDASSFHAMWMLCSKAPSCFHDSLSCVSWGRSSRSDSGDSDSESRELSVVDRDEGRRVSMAARGDPVIEFGLRRAQGLTAA